MLFTRGRADSVDFFEASFFCAATAARESAKGKVSINAIFFIVFGLVEKEISTSRTGAIPEGDLRSAATVLPKTYR